jgi:hypothetical protein
MLQRLPTRFPGPWLEPQSVPTVGHTARWSYWRSIRLRHFVPEVLVGANDGPGGLRWSRFEMAIQSDFRSAVAATARDYVL